LVIKKGKTTGNNKETVLLKKTQPTSNKKYQIINVKKTNGEKKHRWRMKPPSLKHF